VADEATNFNPVIFLLAKIR